MKEKLSKETIVFRMRRLKSNPDYKLKEELDGLMLDRLIRQGCKHRRAEDWAELDGFLKGSGIVDAWAKKELGVPQTETGDEE